MQYSKEQDKQFENYVRQFKDKYRVQKGEDGIWEIICKKGDIEPYSMTELCCYKIFKNRVGINKLKEKLPEYCQITQETANEIVFKFPNERLDEVAAITGAIKRRHLSVKHREIVAKNLLSYQYRSNTPPEQQIDSGV